MEWLWGLAAAPLLLCGLMCVGGMLLAVVGLRRGTSQQAGCHGHQRAERTELPEEASAQA